MAYSTGVVETQVQTSLLTFTGFDSNGGSTVIKSQVYPGELFRLCSILCCHNCKGCVIIPIQHS